VLHPGANLGFGGGCEAGIARATGEFLALLNPDLLFAPGWLDPLLAALADPTVAIAAPVLLNSDHSLQEAGYRLFADGQTRPDLRPLAPGEVRDTDYASAACWVVRRKELIALGGFDPAFHPAYYEDVDVALRVRAAGNRCVVVGSSQLTHLLHGGTPAGGPPDVTPQRRLLLDRWPSIAADYPPLPPELRRAPASGVAERSSVPAATTSPI
jgi:GT2 family glycosyltransferase